MPLYSELSTLSFAELVTAFEQVRHTDGVNFYHEVAGAIRATGDLGIGYLLAKLNTAHINQIRGAILGLIFPPLQEAALARLVLSRLQGHLNHRRPLVRMEAIDALRMLGDRTSITAVLALTADRSAYVRGAVVRFVCKLAPEHIPTLVLPALHDQHYIVRESAIDALEESEQVDAYAAIRPLLDDPHPQVRQAAATAIENLQQQGQSD